jgi:hypothetical protein
MEAMVHGPYRKPPARVPAGIAMMAAEQDDAPMFGYAGEVAAARDEAPAPMVEVEAFFIPAPDWEEEERLRRERDAELEPERAPLAEAVRAIVAENEPEPAPRFGPRKTLCPCGQEPRMAGEWSVPQIAPPPVVIGVIGSPGGAPAILRCASSRKSAGDRCSISPPSVDVGHERHAERVGSRCSSWRGNPPLREHPLPSCR